ncbi:MAG: hypothetical protein Q4G52_00345 [Clostridia bacterium]|nr:hypothetical protein [Clostridia bacterium]
MPEDRRLLRALLSALIAERADADGLYIPRGEAGMRRMIRALLALRPAQQEKDPLRALIETFWATEKEQEQAKRD